MGKKILVYLAFEKTCPATSLWKGAWMNWINYERTLEIACLGRGTCIRLQPHLEKLASVFLVVRWTFLFYLPVRIIVISFGSCIMTKMSSMLCGKFNIVHGSPNLYNLTSVCIFSILFSLHFLWHWQGEFNS